MKLSPITDTVPRARRALVTLNIGARPEFSASHPFFRMYCERFGLDFVVLTERKIRYSPFFFRPRFGVHLEKFQLYELLADYDRILYLDGDVLVTAACPDVLSLVPPEAVGGVYEDVGPDAWKRTEEMRLAERRLGALESWDGGFFNAGVLALSAAHRELFRFERGTLARGRWPDQTTLNYRMARLGVPRHPLAPAFNCLPVFGKGFHDPDRRRAAYLIHYAGKSHKPLFESDLPHVEAAWRAHG